MYYCGWNGCGQVSGQPSFIREPIRLNFDGPIVSVSCSWSLLSVATDKSLTLMGFIGNRSRVSQQVFRGDDCKAVDISSCLNRTLIVSNKGECFDYKADTDTLRQLVNFTKTEATECSGEDLIVKVSCSDNCNLALTKSGKLFNIPSLISTPGLVVTDVSCGNEHCIFLTASSSVYTWGKGSRGQLGHSDLEPEENPRIVEALSGIPVCSISTGAWHNAVLTSSGDLYTWGWGSDGQLGIEESNIEKSEEDDYPKAKRMKSDPETSMAQDVSEKYRGIVQAYPVPVNTPLDVESISCGTRHTVVLLVDGTVWGCGWNAYGQLGCSPENTPRSPTLRQIMVPGHNSKVTNIQCGGWSTCLII